jgi:DNA-binding GntR family transcriptional regulator
VTQRDRSTRATSGNTSPAPSRAGSRSRDSGERNGKRLGDLAYETISALLLESHYPPGTRLSEADLANQLGMSKTPVREALRRMASEGLVTPIPHVGYLIPHLSYRDVRESLEVREAVEAQAARLACERMNPAEITSIKEAFAEAEAAMTGDHAADLERMRAMNQLLHSSLMRAADNMRLEQILESVRNQVERAIRELLHDDFERYKQSFNEHLAVLEALESRDPVAAEAAMRVHVSSVSEHILRRFR